jgi:recombination protein RecT
MSTALAPAKSKLQTLSRFLHDRKDAVKMVLPRGFDAERMVRVAIATASKTPALLQCSPESFYTAVHTAAQLGLDPGGALGGAYLVPYGNTCQLIVGYRGLIDLARRSGQILSIEAHVVHAKDKFECTFGLEPKLTHEPCWDEDPGELRFVYAVARLRGDATQYEVMSRGQVEKIRKGSKSGNGSTWRDHYEEMARKTVVRRLVKYLPLTAEVRDSIEKAERAETGELEIVPDVIEDAQVESGTDALAAAIDVTPSKEAANG